MGKIKYKIINGTKQCGQCGEFKTLEHFYKHKNYYRACCKECNKKNTSKFRKNPANKDKIKQYSKKQYEKPGAKQIKQKKAKERILFIKKRAVDYKGGKCSICGYDKCIEALEFHHLDPSTKDSKLNGRGIDRRKSFEMLKIELDKCVLLCANCHREIHYNNKTI